MRVRPQTPSHLYRARFKIAFSGPILLPALSGRSSKMGKIIPARTTETFHHHFYPCNIKTFFPFFTIHMTNSTRYIHIFLTWLVICNVVYLPICRTIYYLLMHARGGMYYTYINIYAYLNTVVLLGKWHPVLELEHRRVDSLTIAFLLLVHYYVGIILVRHGSLLTLVFPLCI